MSTHIYAADKLEQLVVYSAGGHKDAIVGSFFLNNTLDMISVANDRTIVYWVCNHDLNELTPKSINSKFTVYVVCHSTWQCSSQYCHD